MLATVVGVCVVSSATAQAGVPDQWNTAYVNDGSHFSGCMYLNAGFDDDVELSRSSFLSSTRAEITGSSKAYWIWQPWVEGCGDQPPSLGEISVWEQFEASGIGVDVSVSLPPSAGVSFSDESDVVTLSHDSRPTGDQRYLELSRDYTGIGFSARNLSINHKIVVEFKWPDSPTVTLAADSTVNA